MDDQTCRQALLDFCRAATRRTGDEWRLEQCGSSADGRSEIQIVQVFRRPREAGPRLPNEITGAIYASAGSESLLLDSIRRRGWPVPGLQDCASAEEAAMLLAVQGA